MAQAYQLTSPGTYYFRLTLVDVLGVFKARWEERP